MTVELSTTATPTSPPAEATEASLTGTKYRPKQDGAVDGNDRDPTPKGSADSENAEGHSEESRENPKAKLNRAKKKGQPTTEPDSKRPRIEIDPLQVRCAGFS